MTHGLPVDLALPPPLLHASLWAVVWWVEGIEHARYCPDRALAEACAAAHRGRIVRYAALDPWPTKPG